MARQRKNKEGRLGSIFKTEFETIRLLENRLVASSFEFSAEIELDDSAEAAEQYKALESMRRWIIDIVDGSIVFCPASEISPLLLESLQNNIMITPDDPYDQLLLILICAKLNAIGGKVAHITKCQLISELGDGFGNWFEGDTTDALPTISEWLGDRTFFENSWWNRSDGSAIDIWAGPDDDITVKPDILIDLWPDENTVKINVVEDEPAKIIKHNFKPK